MFYFAEQKSNYITWSTASERNSQWHIVERSKDGTSDWQEVGRLQAKGNSDTVQRYGLEDINPLALSYYRLKAVDFDGQFEYSKVVSVKRDAEGFAVTNVFPVPTEKDVTLQVSLPEATSLGITVTDLVGRTVEVRSMDALKGVNDLVLDVSKYAPGTYFVVIDNGVVKLTERIVKQ